MGWHPMLYKLRTKKVVDVLCRGHSLVKTCSLSRSFQMTSWRALASTWKAWTSSANRIWPSDLGERRVLQVNWLILPHLTQIHALVKMKMGNHPSVAKLEKIIYDDKNEPVKFLICSTI